MNPSLIPIFIGGCDRSGTTMLGDMLGVPPDHICTPESPFKLRGAAPRDASPRERFAIITSTFKYKLWELDETYESLGAPGDYRALLEALVMRYAQAHGRTGTGVWIDHTPRNLAAACLLAPHFPDARYVHVVRDGRAVAASAMALDWGPNTAEAAARWWTQEVALGLAVETHPRFRAVRVRYEDLVREPERTLRNLCKALNLTFDPAMARGGGFPGLPTYTTGNHALVGRPPDPSRADRWRSRMDRRDLATFEHFAGVLLELLGYERAAPPRAPTRAERLRSAVTEQLRRHVVNPIRQRRRARRET